jgi:hypothetical protein
MKRTILTTITLLALSISVKAQQLPKTVTINTADLIGLYSRIDTVNAILHQSELKGTEVTFLMAKIFAGQAPLTATIQRRIKFVADSLERGKKK